MRDEALRQAAIQADLTALLCAQCESMDIYDRSPEGCPACAGNRVDAVLAVVDERVAALTEALTDIFRDMGPGGYLTHIGKPRSDRARALLCRAPADRATANRQEG